MATTPFGNYGGMLCYALRLFPKLASTAAGTFGANGAWTPNVGATQSVNADPAYIASFKAVIAALPGVLRQSCTLPGCKCFRVPGPPQKFQWTIKFSTYTTDPTAGVPVTYDVVATDIDVRGWMGFCMDPEAKVSIEMPDGTWRPLTPFDISDPDAPLQLGRG